jgi:hypothetical protein
MRGREVRAAREAVPNVRSVQAEHVGDLVQVE